MKKIDLQLLAGGGTTALTQPGAVVGQGLSPALSHILNESQREIGVRDQEVTYAPGSGELERLVSQVADRLGFELSHRERDEVVAQLEREQKPFGILQGLVDDPSISDIIITNYAQISVQQGRRNFRTDLAFPSTESYENFVERLLQRAGSSYSTKKPIADGMVGSFARLHAVHRSLCESGPYVTIRLNRFSRVSLDDIERSGMAPAELLEYLRLLVRGGQTLLLVGEVGTGKTTLARALASTIPPDESILVIEDTPEIKLEHPHARYLRTREENTDGAGRVSPSECIRAGMRMAMNRIIFGEMRDAEAAEAFIDVCASGHPGLSTIHARSAAEAMTRLELFLGRAQRGVVRQVLSEQIATAVQVIVYVDICAATGRRRVMEVKEIGPVADGVIRQRDIFQYHVHHGIPSWRVVNRVSAHREMLEQDEPGLALAQLPANLELAGSLQYREAARTSRGGVFG
jgi:pilus assembly protein CpaF